MATKTKGTHLALVVGGVLVTLAMAASKGAHGAEGPGTEVARPHVSAATPEEAGRYLVILGGCNDCHTPGWAESNGTLPEEAWLTGAPVGFQGPWGTSYPANLRLLVQALDEDAWVARMKSGQGLPPMPWVNVTRADEADLRALYGFIRSLGPAGAPAPAAVGPDQTPATPYISMMPVMPAGDAR